MYALIIFFLFGCGAVQPTPIVVENATCEQVCKHMTALDCPSAQPTPNGASCVEVCENVQSSGMIEWNLDCRAAAATCESADECER